MNLSDCQFTILALLPTLSNQILTELDVEGYTAKLANAAAIVRAAEVAAKAKEEREILEKIRRDEAAADAAEAAQRRLAEDEAQERLAIVNSPTLNPSASVFVPSSSPNLASSPSWPAALVTPPFSTLSSDSASIITEEPAMTGQVSEEQVEKEIAADSEQPVNGMDDSVLGKSWSQVVVSQDGEPAEVESIPVRTSSHSIIVRVLKPRLLNQVVENAPPEMSRAELWNEIKILCE